MDIKALANKYKLGKDDFWEMKRGSTSQWIITHDACEKIAVMENIEVLDIKVLNSDSELVRFLITAEKAERGKSIARKVITVGEADRNNCKSQYLGAMAEKRGVDRAILKLINAYEYGIYSDVEADSFKKPETKQPEETYEKATEAQKKLINSLLLDIAASNSVADFQRIQFEGLSYSGASNTESATKSQATKLIDYLKNNS